MRKITSYSSRLFAGILGTLLPALLFTACIRETEYGIPETTYISVKISPNNARTDSRTEQKVGHPDDYKVTTLRVMAFKRTGGAIAVNELFKNVSNGSLVEFSIVVGDYDFVFIANEKSDQYPIAKLDTISRLSGLEQFAFNQLAFQSYCPIPMLQKITNVTVTANGKAILKDGTHDIHGHLSRYSPGTVTETIILGLDRLGVRVDATLISDKPLQKTILFEITGLPDRVPLFADRYSGTITYNEGANRACYAPEKESEGYYIYKNINEGKFDERMIIPTNNDKEYPIILHFRWGGLNDQTGNDITMKLKIDDSYALPYNSWLNVTATYNEKVINQSRGDDDPVFGEGLMETDITVRDW